MAKTDKKAAALAPVLAPAPTPAPLAVGGSSSVPVFLLTYRLAAPLQGDIPPEAIPSFTAPGNYKDEEKIRAYCDEKLQRWYEGLGSHYLLGRVEELCLVDVRRGRLLRWSSEDHNLQDKLAGFLDKHYRQVFPDAYDPSHRCQALVLGFDPKRAVKMLALQGSSLGEGQTEYHRLPLSFWYGNTGLRDLGEICESAELACPWPVLLRLRGLSIPAGWTGPGVRPEVDAAVAMELAVQLGFVVREEHAAK